MQVKLTKKSLEAFKRLQRMEQQLEDRRSSFEFDRAGASTPEPLRTTPRLPAIRTGSAPQQDTVSVTTTSTTRSKRKKVAEVRLASALDGATVEACLEYLTRPHMSWRSALRFAERREERIAEHRMSASLRSLSASRNASFVSLPETDTASVCTAPAGFPVRAPNGSKSATGTLRKGRLGVSCAVPPAATVADISLTVGRSASRGSVASLGSSNRALVKPGRLHDNSINMSPRPLLPKPGKLQDTNSMFGGTNSVLGGSSACSSTAARQRPAGSLVKGSVKKNNAPKPTANNSGPQLTLTATKL